MSSLDIQQLQKSLEPYLSKAIAATCVAQPADPVEYLALHLKHQLTLNETTYSQRKEQQTKIEKERNEHEKLVNEARERIRQEKENALAADAQKAQERNQRIQDIYQQYAQQVEKIQNEQDDIDPDEEEENANSAANEEEADEEAAEEEKAPVDEELEEEINEVRVQLIVSKRKIQQAREALRQLFDEGLIAPFREPLKANPDGTAVPPVEPSPQVFNALKALEILFDRPKRDLKVFHPNGLRRYLPLKAEDLVRQIETYDPNQNQRKLKFRRAKQITRALDKDQLQNENVPALIIADFVQFCCESRKQTKKLQSLKKQEVEQIPEDTSDPQTDSEVEYQDSEDDRPEPNEEEGGEENGEEDDE